ncbi:hypothetical protein O2V63_13320 [Modestobacter sp. VKM Ac-2977]|uniref:hypothetical protein n=1 Tax=Modestobacter sp. VKM Ac-2977 TaxID=3004131 RepID=UPI0022AA7C5D|nr:hypothetical protein [Modestobacter sp. VKM Ac-2977]MCZ2821319.1 hypothetical protein [Modestobacter sp. VKM Ac-2977]
MSDAAGWMRLSGDRPARTSSATLLLILVAWVVVPPLLAFGGAIGAAPFLGEQPTTAERAQATGLFVVAAVLALGLPLLGVMLTWRTRKAAAACFGAAMIVVAILIAPLLAQEFRGDVGGAQVDSGPPVCQEHSGGDNRCPGG